MLRKNKFPNTPHLTEGRDHDQEMLISVVKKWVWLLFKKLQSTATRGIEKVKKNHWIPIFLVKAQPFLLLLFFNKNKCPVNYNSTQINMTFDIFSTSFKRWTIRTVQFVCGKKKVYRSPCPIPRNNFPFFNGLIHIPNANMRKLTLRIKKLKTMNPILHGYPTNSPNTEYYIANSYFYHKKKRIQSREIHPVEIHFHKPILQRTIHPKLLISTKELENKKSITRSIM